MSANSHPHFDVTRGAHYLGEYLPTSLYGSQDIWTRMVLDVKDEVPYAIHFFKAEIHQCLSAMRARHTDCIAVIPSHFHGTQPSGIRTLAQLVADHRFVDATACLVRTHTIDKLANGGRRSADVHLDSLAVRHVNLIHGRRIFLLDDVMTTGNSLRVGREMLMDAGAHEVICIALGARLRR